MDVRCSGCWAMHSRTALGHRGNMSCLIVPCAVCTTVQRFATDLCSASVERWPFAICGCPHESHRATMRWTGRLGLLAMTSTMWHVSAYQTTVPSYGNTWHGTSTMSNLGLVSSGGSSPCRGVTRCRLHRRAFEGYQAAALQSPAQSHRHHPKLAGAVHRDVHQTV